MIINQIVKDKNIIFNIDSNYTEVYNNGDELRFITTELYENVLWENPEFSSTELYPTYIGSLPINFILNGNTYTLIKNTSRNTQQIGGLLRFNESVLEVLSNKQKNLKQLKDIKIDFNCEDLNIPNISITLNKYQNKFVNFKEGDYLDINGLKFIFKSTPTQINHIKPTGRPKDDLIELLNKINISNDPRVRKDIFVYELDESGESITITAKNEGLADKWSDILSYSIVSSNRPIPTGTYDMFVISDMIGDIVDIYFGYSEIPIISNYILLSDIKECIDFNPNIEYYLGIKFIRHTTNENYWIQIKQINLEVDFLYTTINTATWAFSAGETIIIQPQDQYKVFKLTGFKINIEGANTLDINFRWSDNNGRNWSYWIPLSRANLIVQKVNPLGFFKIEYQVKNTGNSPVYLFDIQLEGDFVNITCDYMKMAILGINTCCIPNIVGDSGGECPPVNPFEEMTYDVDALWKPYQKDEVFNLYKKRLDTVNNMFGWNVEYYKTDPDYNSADPVMHEIGLSNTIMKKNIKIIVPDNQFPDRKVAINPFTMGFLDNFIINITKEEFKSKFGLTYRPAKDDVIKICDTNRLYQVEQAYPMYDFMNMSTFYEVVLNKYQDKASRDMGDMNLEKELKSMIENSTLDGLFGVDVVRNEDQVTKDTYQPLTREWSRSFTNDLVCNLNEIIEVQSMILSKYQYDLTMISNLEDGVRFRKYEVPLSAGHSRSWTMLFNIRGVVGGKRSLMKSTASDKVLWEIWMQDSTINFTINEYTYSLNCIGLSIKKWHGLIINMDQPRKDLEIVVFSLIKNKPITVIYKKQFDFVPTSFGNIDYQDSKCDVIADIEKAQISLNGGFHYITNIRIFNTYIPKERYSYILQQYMLKDTKDIILIDNAQPIQILPNFGGINNAQY